MSRRLIGEEQDVGKDQQGEPLHGVVTTVMHDTVDLDAAVVFWTNVLGLEVVHRSGNFAYLDRLGGQGSPRLAFQQVPEVRADKNRLHLDIRVADRAEFEQKVVALGGRVIGEHQELDFPTWTVMADPEGNQFCIYEVDAEGSAPDGPDAA